MTTTTETPRLDVYSRITNQIIEALEQGVKPWTQPWNAAHAAGHVSRPLRHNGQPYAGINVLTLWASAMAAHYAAPTARRPRCCQRRTVAAQDRPELSHFR